ncbi:MAG: transporter substrate-binding domain-containing protein [Oscillospiraceae bacterium]
MKNRFKPCALILALLMCVSLFAGCSKSNEPGYTAVDTQANALMEVKSGTADVAIIDYTMAKTMTGEGTDYSDLQIIDGIELAVEEYAIGFRNGSNLVGQVNDAMNKLLQDGTLAEIAEKYDLTLSMLESFTPSDEAGTAEEDDWAYIQEKGKLIIGITEYAPMNYYDESGRLIGFDTEFAEAVCEILGVTPEFIVINWDTKEIELQAKSIDCIWNGLTVTEERKENMDFSASYIKNMQVPVIASKNKDRFKTVDDLKKAALVAEAGSAGETEAKSLAGVE